MQTTVSESLSICILVRGKKKEKKLFTMSSFVSMPALFQHTPQSSGGPSSRLTGKNQK